MRSNGWTGDYEDDMAGFFDRHPSKVSSADVFRFRAAAEALREIDKR